MAGLPKDTNGIYNSLTRIPSYSFNELLSRVNEYAMVEDDELVTFGPVGEKKRGNDNFDNTKRKKKDFSKVSEDGYKEVKTFFNMPIHKIINGGARGQLEEKFFQELIQVHEIEW